MTASRPVSPHCSVYAPAPPSVSNPSYASGDFLNALRSWMFRSGGRRQGAMRSRPIWLRRVTLPSRP